MFNTTGANKTANGFKALYTNNTGANNTATGYEALYSNTTGSNNNANGYFALKANTTGSNNIAVGHSAGDALTTGSNNVIIGYEADPSAVAAANQIVIGKGATGQADNSVVLGNADVTEIYMAQDKGAKVWAGDAEFSGTVTIGTDLNITSDSRLKDNIKPLGSTISKLQEIEGKTYMLKRDQSGASKIGVLAQDVQTVFPELVAEGSDGVLSVNYTGLIPVLINAINEQDAKIEKLQEMIRFLSIQQTKSDDEIATN
jgi:hypothetical protein